MATVLKIAYGKDIRRSSLADPQSLTWPQLQKKIGDMLGIDMHRMHVTYKDDEEDMISIHSTEELSEAVRLATPPIFRLHVSKKPTPPSTPPRDGEDVPALPNLSEVLSALAAEMPMLRPVIHRLHHGVNAVRAGGAWPPAAHPAGGAAGPSDLKNPGAPPAAAAADAPHPLHTCDVCDVSPIRGVRYHSKLVPDFDLCTKCYETEGAKAAAKNEQKPFDEAYEKMRASLDYHSCAQPGPCGPWRARGGRGGGAPHCGPRGMHGGGGCGMRGGDGVFFGPGHLFAFGPGGGEWAAHRPGARFIRDVTMFDGTEVAPASKFTKIWRLRNEGANTWPPGTQLAFSGGDQLEAAEHVAVPAPVEPGQEVDIAVDMCAPDKLGRYVSYWRLTTPRGKRFGQRIWVNVTVVDPSTPPSADPMELEGAPAAPQETDRGAHDDQEDSDKHGNEQEHPGLLSLGRVFSDMINHAATVEAVEAAEAAASHAEAAEDDAAPNTADAEMGDAATEPKPAAAQGDLALLSFPVEVADGRRLTISWQLGADAQVVAVAFAREHALPADDMQDIVRFVKTAEALVTQQRQPQPRAAAETEIKPEAAPELLPKNTAEPVAKEPVVDPVAASAVAALRAMGFAHDEALLAAIVANNGSDIVASVLELSALSEMETLLSDLEAMGFEDAARNRSALAKSRGDVRLAVRELMKAGQTAAAPASV